jgi:hypothetical protein
MHHRNTLMEMKMFIKILMIAYQHPLKISLQHFRRFNFYFSELPNTRGIVNRSQDRFPSPPPAYPLFISSRITEHPASVISPITTTTVRFWTAVFRITGKHKEKGDYYPRFLLILQNKRSMRHYINL